jgi:potassium/chloride transporter 9
MAGSFSRATLLGNGALFQEATSLPPMVEQAILVSAFSSGLQALFGGSRILQAIARDNLFPCLKPFAYGSANGDEPRVAVLLTWAIAQLFCLTGQLDAVAAVVTCCFCVTYGLVNFSCALLRLSGTPNFRPSFRYWSWQMSMLGFLMNIG